MLENIDRGQTYNTKALGCSWTPYISNYGRSCCVMGVFLYVLFGINKGTVKLRQQVTLKCKWLSQHICIGCYLYLDSVL